MTLFTKCTKKLSKTLQFFSAYTTKNSDEVIVKQDKWVKVFKNGPSKVWGRQPLKNFTWSILENLDPNLFKIPKNKEHLPAS